jgi:hypothetical protein
MTLSVGSYSHGTLCAQDLAYTLRDMLRGEGVADCSTIMCELAAIAEDEGRDEEHDSAVISDAMDILQAYAPPYCYVGMHEGDGSDLGVWFSHDCFEDACRDGEILKLSDSSEIDDMAKEDIAAYNYIAIVSDHGNVSLYHVKVTLGDEVFSIV